MKWLIAAIYSLIQARRLRHERMKNLIVLFAIFTGCITNTGRVLDENTQIPVPNIVIIYINSDGSVYGYAISDVNGEWELEVPYDWKGTIEPLGKMCDYAN